PLQDVPDVVFSSQIEAREACDWLRAAGFPQYAQLFRDCRFPVDVEWAKRDHSFLDKDALDSLCRRLNTLNRCMETKMEPRRSKRREDQNDEEDFCAISPSWTFDRQARRWRRLDSEAEAPPPGGPGASPCDGADRHDVCSVNGSSGSESEGQNLKETSSAVASATATPSTTDDHETSRTSSRCSSTNRSPSTGASLSGPPSPGPTAGSEAEGRFQEKPPRKKGSSLLKKMEKIRLRESRGLNSHSGTPTQPVLLQEEDRGHCPTRWCHVVSVSSLQIGTCGHASAWASSSSSNSQSESSSAVSTPSPVARVRSNCKRSCSSVGVNSATRWTSRNRAASEEESLVFQIPYGHKPGTFPTFLTHKSAVLSPAVDASVNWRTGSFHGYRGQRGCGCETSSLAAAHLSPPDVRGPPTTPDHRVSVYDNMPGDQQRCGSASNAEEAELSRLMEDQDVFSALDSVLERIGRLQQLVSSWSESLSKDNCQDTPGSSAASPCPSSLSHIHLEVQRSEEEEEQVEVDGSIEKARRSQRIRVPFHALLWLLPSRRASQQQHWCSEQSLTAQPTSPGVENQSVSQFTLLRKLALLKLTALMDKHSPTSRQGWNWAVPKQLRKTKLTEVKGRRVFRVPLLVSLQQTGEPLPPSILRALRHLRAECLDQVGLFRKSGVKSRIQFLRDLVESDPDGVSYEGHSAFDVADMVKQYFRDLPEPVFTSKLCETFLHIYQYFPKDQQLLASQAAILLLPDENREALRVLLFFLRDVVACVDENQMTPTNIAVCLAPSLFHLNTLKKDAKLPSYRGRSSRRKCSLGRPDQRDLSENLAATQGLAHMITEAQRLFQVPKVPEEPCSEGPGEPESRDLRRDQEEEQDQQRRRLQRSTQHLLMEAREKNRGWEGHPAPENVDLAFKKVDDGCPLWMWRGSVEVEATETQLLHRLVRQPQLWERNLHRASVVQTLSGDAEVFRCLLQGQGQGLGPGPRPPQEHLLLRIWQADPTCGPLYLSSVSTEHPEVLPEGVRAHVHSCLYLLEPSGTRRTRLTHVCRTDTRGRSLGWHIKASGHLLASELLAIRDSFRKRHRLELEKRELRSR
uniref:Si:dkeyp-23e4.3 n=1 Tax=Tetraodon nigroviridis TaxID=99883 RepID=H3CQA1_TETNG